MRLMKYSPSDWLDIMAMKVEGAASSSVNVVLQDVATSCRATFLTWRQFYAGHDSLVRASDRDRGGPKIVAGIEADRSS